MIPSSPSRRQRREDGADALTRRYQILRSVLKKNGAALKLLADLEADLDHVEPHDDRVRLLVHRLGDVVLLMAQELNLLTGRKHRQLAGVVVEILSEVDRVFLDTPSPSDRPLAIDLTDAQSEDATLVGGKTAGLALLRGLDPTMIPDGFVISTAGYRRFIEINHLQDTISTLLSDIDMVTDRDQFAARTQEIRERIERGRTPPEVAALIAELAARFAPDPATTWAVRSSAQSEDDRFSFAGQFESRLRVVTADLQQAYRGVIAGRFTDRAVMYRAYCGVREVETPMAVLFMLMIDARAAGVLHTLDGSSADDQRMVLTCTPGLADRVLRGEDQGDTVWLSRDLEPQLLDVRTRSEAPEGAPWCYLPRTVLPVLAAAALRAVERLGHELDIEWAVDRGGRLWLLQGRRLHTAPQISGRPRLDAESQPLIESGVTIAPGRAEGPVEFWRQDSTNTPTHKAPVLVAEIATPEIAALLPRIAALLVRHGNPAGHTATLVREFAVPTVFQVGDTITLLNLGETISVDASRRRVFRGPRWDGIRDRVLDRLRDPRMVPAHGPLHDAVLALNLTDPYASSFRPRSCRSLHDVIRYIHEMSIRSLFAFGDRHSRPWWRTSRRLVSPLPVEVRVIEMQRGRARPWSKVTAEEIDSIPFQAFWRGATDPSIDWTASRVPELDWMPTAFVETVMGGDRGPRRRGDANFLVVAPDYLNLNARMAFHYAMIDAVIGPGKEGNHVHFRIRGGGADDRKQRRRARFLELVLRHQHFTVDRRGNLVTAWMRGYPAADSEQALTMLGRLMGYARQLDMRMIDDEAPRRFVSEFLSSGGGPVQ
jgi:pyruvate,water dikinase